MRWLARLKHMNPPADGQPLQGACPAPATQTPPANEQHLDPERWGRAEMVLYLQRLDDFARMGAPDDKAIKLADQLQQRDRAGLDMHACLECAHCQRGRCCGGRQLADIGPDLGQLAYTLQRCAAFKRRTQ